MDTEKVKSEPNKFNIRTFRSSPEVENFYRFIYDNKLREESRLALEEVVKLIAPPKKKRSKKRGRKKVQ